MNWISQILTNPHVWNAVATLVAVIVHVVDGGWDDE